jgi:hypothetical protein
MDINEALLRAILEMVARQTFPPSEVFKIVSPTVGGQKQLRAYNLCDGRTPQSEIGKRVQLDKGYLSRSISRWIDVGIMTRVGADLHPMHIYPLRKGDLS